VNKLGPQSFDGSSGTLAVGNHAAGAAGAGEGGAAGAGEGMLAQLAACPWLGGGWAFKSFLLTVGLVMFVTLDP